MRTLVLLLMIALVPLRVWAADGMAVRMAQAGMAAPVDAADTRAAPEDCHMAMAAVHAAHSEGASHAPDDNTAAAQCMACHLCAACTVTAQARLGLGPAPAGPPEPFASHYQSADIARALRPPIS